MRIDITSFIPYDKNADNCLPDMYCVLVVLEQKYGDEIVRLLDVAIHVFSEQRFVSKGIALENVIAYKEYELYDSLLTAYKEHSGAPKTI